MMRIQLYVASLLGLAAAGCIVGAERRPLASERLEDAGESLRSPNGRGNDAYQPCYGDQTLCREPNSACARYVSDPEMSFCAPVCERDEECPAAPGFEAACNFAFCALLCDEDGACPDGMTCVPGSSFIDGTGEGRGIKDVCVTTP